MSSNLKNRAQKRLKARIKAYEDVRDPKEKRMMRKPGSLSGRK